MKRLTTLLALAACGSSDEPTPDAQQMFPQPTGAVLVQVQESGERTGGTSTLTFSPTAAHSLLVVAVMAEAEPVAMTTATGRRLERDFRSGLVYTACGRSFELWTLGDVDAGIAGVEVELRAPAAHAMAAFEVGGLSRFPLVTSANLASNGPPLPVLELEVDEGNFLLAAMATCGTNVTIDPAGFKPLASHFGIALAYDIVGADGTRRASWTYDPATAHALLFAYR